MALFTGKGDGGTTKVFDSKDRIPKSSELPEALGSLDELNSYLGLAKVRARQVQDSAVKVEGKEHATSEILKDIQETLFIIQAEVAGAEKSVTEEKVAWVSAVVNTIEKEIPPITAFIIAGGTELSAILDVARSLARRAERRIVAVENTGARALSPHTRAYLNRLSSLLFALSRLVNAKSGIKEENPSYK
jgi:cob(I)alamin adenosyltransferase